MMKFIQRMQQARAARLVREELNKMSDYQLKDIGITRGDIANVANGTYSR